MARYKCAWRWWGSAGAAEEIEKAGKVDGSVVIK